MALISMQMMSGESLHLAEEAPLLARALVLAARGTPAQPAAESAWSAATASPPIGEGWTSWAQSTAASLGLRATVIHEPRADVDAPTIVRGAGGSWFVATGRRGDRVRVHTVGCRSDRARWLSITRWHALVGDGPVVRVQPLFALEGIATRSDRRFQGRSWLRLRAFLRLEGREIGVITIYAVVIGALTLATPVAVQALVNTVAFGTVLQPLVVLSFMLFGSLAFAGTLTVLEAYVVEFLQRRVFVRVADDFGRRLTRLDPEALDQKDGTELVNRFFDVMTIQKSLATLLLDGLSLALQTTIGMVLLGFYHPVLLAFDALLITMMVGILFLGRGAVATASKESTAKYRSVAWLENVVAVAKTIRGRSVQVAMAERTEMLSRDYLSARKSHFRILLRQIIGGVGLQVLAMVALLGVGGWLVMARQLTLGQLVAAELVVAAMGSGFVKLGKNLEKVYDLNVAVLKISQVVDCPIERGGGQRRKFESPASVELRQASIARGSSLRLKGIDLHLQAGDRVWLRGPSGAGKSTFLDLLAGLRTVTSGSVHWGGYDARELHLATLRERIALVRGAPFLTATVAENLTLGRDVRDEAYIRPVLRTVELEAVIDALPQGLQTPMLPDGAPLSESHGRRLALARALLMRPSLLLLDGALDRLGLSDSAMEQLLAELFGPEAPWTAIVVTERGDVSAACSTVWDVTETSVEVAS